MGIRARAANRTAGECGESGVATLPAGCPRVESAGCADLGMRAKRQPIGGAFSPVCPHDAKGIIHRGRLGRNGDTSSLMRSHRNYLHGVSGKKNRAPYMTEPRCGLRISYPKAWLARNNPYQAVLGARISQYALVALEKAFERPLIGRAGKLVVWCDVASALPIE